MYINSGQEHNSIGKEIYRKNRTKSCVRSNGYSIGRFLLKRGTWQGDPKMRTFQMSPLDKNNRKQQVIIDYNRFLLHNNMLLFKSNR